MKQRSFVGICFDLLTIVVCVILLFNITACCSDEAPFKGKLIAYLEKDLPIVNRTSEKYAAYFDFTGAMIACNNDTTNETFNGLCQKITGSSVSFDIYKLGNTQISEFSDDLLPAQVFLQIKQASNNLEFYAPIEKTLKKITDEGRPAVLITDFEEYTTQGDIYRQAYATPYFQKWLECGGDITFFITDYKENNLPKHLFYVVFDSNHHDLLNLVEEGLEGLPRNYKKFTLATNSYPMKSSYLSAKQGGTFHDDSGEDIVSCSVEDGTDDGFFKLDSLRAESYVFSNTWEDIIKNAGNQTIENGVQVPFTHLFRHLYIDLSESDSYELIKLGVKVYDIQDDFDKYWGYYVAKNNKPKIIKEAGEIYLDYEGVEAGKPFYDDSGKIKSEFDYPKEPGNINEIHDMLDFDNDLFESSFHQNPAETELGIYFHKGFTGKIYQQDNNDALIRIDIVPAEVNICNLDTIDTLFGWPGNDCLSSSVKSVLQDLKPIGKPIYSYFIRIQ